MTNLVTTLYLASGLNEQISDPITGLSSGTGFVTFVDADNGKTALRELDRFDLGGKRIRVSAVDDKKVK